MVIVAGYILLAPRATVGVKTAVDPEYVTVPSTAVASGPVTLKDAVVIVVLFIISLNVAVILLLICTPVSPFAGTVEVTVGAMLSVPAPVVKVNTKSLRLRGNKR